MEATAFETFYQASLTRLQALNEAYNQRIVQDPLPLVQPFQEEFARMNGGGKMLRGMLVNLGYRLAGGTDSSYSDELALAFELFQTAVLIHDDIIDQADTRRDKPTIHRIYEERLKQRGIRMVSAAETEASLGRSAALCVGDLGLYYANRQVAECYRQDPKLGDLICYFDQIILDTIRGELLDVILPYELQDPSHSEAERKMLLRDSIREIYHLKTAYYSVIGPLHLGMLLGGMPEENMRELDEICDLLGIAFQIKDDLLGVFSDAAETGKDAGSDISEYKQTILYQYVMTEAVEYREELLRYYGEPVITEELLQKVRELFRSSGAYDEAVREMEVCFSNAEHRLEQMEFLDEESHEILKGFITYLRERTK